MIEQVWLRVKWAYNVPTVFSRPIDRPSRLSKASAGCPSDRAGTLVKQVRERAEYTWRRWGGRLRRGSRRREWEGLGQGAVEQEL